MRKWNFCAGPATMPESVLKETQEELNKSINEPKKYKILSVKYEEAHEEL